MRNHKQKRAWGYAAAASMMAGWWLGAGFAAAQPAASGAAHAYPTRPLRLVVPYPPGGANDTVARVLSPRVSEQLGQQLVIDNRGGGNTIIGSELVAKATPDGYTLLMVAAGHAVNPALYPKLPYDSARDFAQVVLLGDGAYVLVAHPAAGALSVPELIAAAKAQPGKIVYASSSIGNLTHLAAELFASLAGVKMLHVPYKGGGPAMLDLLAGRVAIFFSTVAVARPHIQSGKIRGLGVTTAQRSAALPAMPTIAEAGLPGYEVSGWYGIIAPAKTPPPVIERINGVVRGVLRQADVKERLLAAGVQASDISVQQFDQLMRAEFAKWQRLAKPLGISLD
ncbi:MAG: tripartite tricarboxylate transporter substrate binding protein [Betaproteobacteria bacterium]|nr:tripartite tricarboxylate transporter substrate binding protein [Betaproteobacteria bacterium]